MLNRNIQSISNSRLSPYLKICDGNTIDAMCVYTSLQHRAALYFTVIQEIEIAFRNELSYKIEEWLITDPSSPKVPLYEYFINPIYMSAYLNSEGQTQLTKAYKDVQRNYSSKFNKLKQKQIKKAIKKGLVLPSDQQILALVPMPNHNDMISHLTFGFWVHLLNPDPIKNPNTTYWQNIFTNLFDNRFGTNLNLFTRLQDVLRFRNDLYHQEAVWKNKGIKNPIKALQNLETKFNNFLGYLSKISLERFTTINESYNLTNVMKQMFDQHKFSVEIENLREIFIGPGLTN